MANEGKSNHETSLEISEKSSSARDGFQVPKKPESRSTFNEEAQNARSNPHLEFQDHNGQQSFPAVDLAWRQDPKELPLSRLAAITCIAAGVQFGWAIQLSLLTPYVQTLGIPHQWASFIWLCGPISGMVVQPVVGVWSDRCQHRLGRRRPFLIAGSALIVLAVLLIAYSSELGFLLGDRVDSGFRPFACIVFVLGFWCLDLSNNTVQGPSRALLADLTSKGQCNTANSLYSLWIAIGSVLGYSAGAVGNWHVWFPFLTSEACSEPCANLKAAFLLHILFLAACATITCTFAEETPLVETQKRGAEEGGIELQRHDQQGTQSSTFNPHFQKETGQGASNSSGGGRLKDKASEGCSAVDLDSSAAPHNSNQKGMSLGTFWSTLRRKIQIKGARDDEGTSLTSTEAQTRQDRQHANANAPPAGFLETLLLMPALMHVVLGITALSWMSWFPFLLFDTDWMGREIFHGDPSSRDPATAELYQAGVREGALGLLLFSVVQGVASALLDPLCRRMGPGAVWGSANVLSASAMLAICLLSVASTQLPSDRLLPYCALVIFASLGASFATTMVVPFTLAAQSSAEAGLGIGLSMGMLNMAIVVPQVLVSFLSGPLDGAFGGGNVPGFVAACVFASIAAVGAFSFLPSDLAMSGSLDLKDMPHI